MSGRIHWRKVVSFEACTETSCHLFPSNNGDTILKITIRNLYPSPRYLHFIRIYVAFLWYLDKDFFLNPQKFVTSIIIIFTLFTVYIFRPSIASIHLTFMMTSATRSSAYLLTLLHLLSNHLQPVLPRHLTHLSAHLRHLV